MKTIDQKFFLISFGYQTINTQNRDYFSGYSALRHRIKSGFNSHKPTLLFNVALIL